MTAIVDAQEFKTALSFVSRAIERRNTIPVLGMARMWASGDGMKLAGTNLDLRLEQDIPARANGGANLLIAEPKSLLRAVKASDAAEIEFSETKDGVDVNIGNFSLSTSGVPKVDDWPESTLAIWRDADFAATLGEDAITAIARVVPAMSLEETRYYLNGICLEKSGEPWAYTAVATDGHRLFMADIPIPDARGELPRIIVPRQAIGLICEFARGKEPVQFSLHRRAIRNEPDSTLAPDPKSALYLRVRCGNRTLVSKLIDGTYPDYRRVIPEAQGSGALFKVPELRQRVRMFLAGQTGKSTCALKMVLSSGRAEISTRWGEMYSSAGCCVSYEGDAELTVGINGHYLLAALDAVRSDEILFLFTSNEGGQGDPMRLVSPADDTFQAVQMPMRPGQYLSIVESTRSSLQNSEWHHPPFQRSSAAPSGHR